MTEIKETPRKQEHRSITITAGMSVDDYVSQSTNLHNVETHHGALNGGILQFSRKVGDMALAVIPKNRFWCAVGLTSGGFAGLKLGGLLTGRNLSDHSEINIENVPKLLKPLHGVIKYDPHSSAPVERWKRVAGLFTFTAVSFAGIVAGAKHAYRSSHKRNENPENLEDYAARTSQHQGDKWRFLAASSGVFGSSAGTFLIPYVPGVNYASSIASYTVLNQDRKIMTPGLKGLSGTKTTSYLGLREGVDYICKYAVNNPAKDPAELEFLALTVMAPLAHAADVKLTPENIKTFVDKVHTVRDQYWQEGGIPRDQRKTAMKAMEAEFKGKGLDKTLFESGIDTTRIDFAKLNGIIGKVGNTLGATKYIKDDQEAYRAKAAEWRKDWACAPLTPQPTAEAGISLATQAEQKSFAREDLKKPSTPLQARPVSHQEALANQASTGMAIGA